jgi:uncharacterized membrane protein
VEINYSLLIVVLAVVSIDAFVIIFVVIEQKEIKIHAGRWNFVLKLIAVVFANRAKAHKISIKRLNIFCIEEHITEDISITLFVISEKDVIFSEEDVVLIFG